MADLEPRNPQPHLSVSLQVLRPLASHQLLRLPQIRLRSVRLRLLKQLHPCLGSQQLLKLQVNQRLLLPSPLARHPPPSPRQRPNLLEVYSQALVKLQALQLLLELLLHLHFLLASQQPQVQVQHSLPLLLSLSLPVHLPRTYLRLRLNLRLPNPPSVSLVPAQRRLLERLPSPALLASVHRL